MHFISLSFLLPYNDFENNTIFSRKIELIDHKIFIEKITTMFKQCHWIIKCVKSWVTACLPTMFTRENLKRKMRHAFQFCFHFPFYHMAVFNSNFIKFVSGILDGFFIPQNNVIAKTKNPPSDFPLTSKTRPRQTI